MIKDENIADMVLAAGKLVAERDARIAALEAENARLREALRELADNEWRDDDDPVLVEARNKARAAIR